MAEFNKKMTKRNLWAMETGISETWYVLDVNYKKMTYDVYGVIPGVCTEKGFAGSIVDLSKFYEYLKEQGYAPMHETEFECLVKGTWYKLSENRKEA